MKIIILTDDFPPKSGGGAAIIASMHARALTRAGHTVLVITTVEDRADVGESIEDGMRVVRLYSKYPAVLRAYLSLHNPFILRHINTIFKREQPDIIHAHNIHYHISYRALQIARRYTKRLYHTLHDSMAFHYSKLYPNYRITPLRQLIDFRFRFNPFKNSIVRHYLKIPDTLFAVSDALKQTLAHYGITNVTTVHNAIDPTLWRTDPARVSAFKTRYGLMNSKVIMFCGRLSRAKGAQVLIDILPHLVTQIPNLKLLVVGHKDEVADNMLLQAQKMGLDQHILCTGALGQQGIAEAYRASSALVVPSLCYDWFPTVNLEAMACGIPVVATKYGGSSEAVADGVTGYIVDPYHSDELAAKIIDILTHSDRAEAFGAAGFARVVKDFNIQKYISNQYGFL